MDEQEQLRRTAFAVAYRMLGSVADAEDVGQDALLALHQARLRGEVVRSAPALVTTIATRLAIDVLRSARVRRESYVGDGLPEPLSADPGQDPEARAELADSLSMAFLVLLEALTPEQRAALLLHDVFDYGYDEVADALGTTPANARQLTARARRHAKAGAPRFVSTPEQLADLTFRFAVAIQAGDLGALQAVLAPDVVLRGDGGGRVPALARPVYGRLHVARTLLAWARAGVDRGALVEFAQVNGGPGVLTRDPEGRVLSVLSVEAHGGHVVGLWSVVNPTSSVTAARSGRCSDATRDD